MNLTYDAQKALHILATIYRLPEPEVLEVVLIKAAERAVEALYREVDALLARHPEAAVLAIPTPEPPEYVEEYLDDEFQQ